MALPDNRDRRPVGHSHGRMEVCNPFYCTGHPHWTMLTEEKEGAVIDATLPTDSEPAPPWQDWRDSSEDRRFSFRPDDDGNVPVNHVDLVDMLTKLGYTLVETETPEPVVLERWERTVGDTTDVVTFIEDGNDDVHTVDVDDHRTLLAEAGYVQTIPASADEVDPEPLTWETIPLSAIANDDTAAMLIQLPSSPRGFLVRELCRLYETAPTERSDQDIRLVSELMGAIVVLDGVEDR